MVLSKSNGNGGVGNREDVIETLIDMDPCGAAYRVSKAMVRIICKSIVFSQRRHILCPIILHYLMIFMLTPTQYALLLVTLIPSTSNAIHHYTVYID